MSSTSNQTVVPMRSYPDGLAALTWLAEAFGFVEGTRYVGEGGRLAHGETMAGGNIIAGHSNGRLRRANASSISLRACRCMVVGSMDRGWGLGLRGRCCLPFGAHQSPRRPHPEREEDGPPGKRYRVEDLEGIVGC